MTWENLWDGRSRSCLDLESKHFVSERVGWVWAGSVALRVGKLFSSLSAECVSTGADSGVVLDFGEVSEGDGTWVVPGASWEDMSWEKVGLDDLRGLFPPFP